MAGKTVQYMFYDLFKDYIELKAETLSSSCFLNDGKGNFKRDRSARKNCNWHRFLHLLPFLIVAMIIFAAGNFYGVLPYEGRYDAMTPTLFSYHNAQFSLQSNLPFIDGEVRDAKWINYSGKKVLVIARNNDQLIFLKPKE